MRSIQTPLRGDHLTMRMLRPFLPVLVLGAVLTAFIGVSAAMEGDDPPVTDPTTTTVAPSCDDDTDAPAADDTDATEADDATDDTDATESDDATEADDASEEACDDDADTTDGTDTT